jgi:hypothetical protein
MSTINLWQKALRAQVIKEHLGALGTNKCVCFSCGNAARALVEVGLNVVYVGNNAPLAPNRWFTYTEIAKTFGLFDATSGHLPMPLMMAIAAKMVESMPAWEGTKQISTGSGETIVCLKLAYPNIRFVPKRYATAETAFNIGAPLNTLIKLLFNNKQC